MTILQFSLALSSSSSSASFPVSLGSNFKIPSKYIPSLSHFLNSKHSHLLHLPNSRVSGSPTNKSRFSKSKITCSAKSVDLESSEIVKEKSVSVILLAGGKGKRMGANMPKQYLPLLGQPIALYSFYTFSHMIEVKEIIVVCDPSYKDIFEDIKENIHVDLKFTLPGKERQDSVYSGLQAVDVKSELVCIHDSARPLVTTGDVKMLILLKASEQVIYSGPLGQHSSSGIEYFEATSGVQKIRNNYNPATWMLEITSRSAEAQLCIDFAQVYKNCVLYQNNREHVNRWSTPPPDSFELNSQQGVFNPLCSIFSATIFLGINNSSSVLPYAATERSRCMVRGLMHLLRSRLRFCISKSK